MEVLRFMLLLFLLNVTEGVLLTDLIGNKSRLGDRIAECGYQNARIIGGKESHRERWPWVVSLKTIFGRHFCGGCLLTRRHILTAAHCVSSQERFPFLLSVSVVSYNQIGGHDYWVRRIHVHPNFGEVSTYDNDVAILTLSSTISKKHTYMPACLPPIHQLGHTLNTSMSIVGWGRVKEIGTNSEVLREATVNVLNNIDCQSYADQWQDDNKMICAGYTDGRIDACVGDSGGPLLYHQGDRYFIAGLVSFGKGCGRKGYPGVYTNVTTYIDWINSKITEKENTSWFYF